MNTVVYAGGLAGTCGDRSTGCTLDDLGSVIKNSLTYFFKFASVVFVFVALVSIVRLMLATDKGVALKSAKDSLWNVFLGFIIIGIPASIVMYLAFIQFAGVTSQFMGYIRAFLSEVDTNLVQHAYAQVTTQNASSGSGTFTNPLGVDNLYDFVLLLLNLVIKWFIYPAMLFAWLITGFRYVAAQGNPTKITEAHQWLWWSFIGTVVSVMLKGFAIALKGIFS
jgi:hypothetical protein